MRENTRIQNGVDDKIKQYLNRMIKKWPLDLKP